MNELSQYRNAVSQAPKGMTISLNTGAVTSEIDVLQPAFPHTYPSALSESMKAGDVPKEIADEKHSWALWALKTPLAHQPPQYFNTNNSLTQRMIRIMRNFFQEFNITLKKEQSAMAAAITKQPEDVYSLKMMIDRHPQLMEHKKTILDVAESRSLSRFSLVYAIKNYQYEGQLEENDLMVFLGNYQVPVGKSVSLIFQ